MMRRLTSAPNPCARVRRVHARAGRRACRPASDRGARESRSARRRSAPGSSSLRRWRPGSRPESRRRHAAGRCRPGSRRAPRARRAPAVNAAATSASTPLLSIKRARARRSAAPRTSPVSAALKSGTGSRRARRVRRIGAGDHRQRERGIADGPGQRTDLIERRGERQQPVARDAAVGRLQPDDAAQRRRLADRSAGVGAERERRHAGGDGHRRSAARSAGNAIGRPRIPRRAERRVLGRRSHRELVAVGLADDDGAGRLEPRDDGGVERRHERLEDPRRGGRPDAARAEVVLERDRHAGQRTIAPAIAVAIDRGGALERALARSPC